MRASTFAYLAATFCLN